MSTIVILKKHHFFGWKSISTFRNWTKKMSKIEKLRDLPTKKFSSLHILKLACGHKKNNFQFVTIKFFIYFLRRVFRDFLLVYITNNG